MKLCRLFREGLAFQLLPRFILEEIFSTFETLLTSFPDQSTGLMAPRYVLGITRWKMDSTADPDHESQISVDSRATRRD
jgi:hypothetical protein